MVAKNCTEETRLRVLHWKILHNIYPSGTLLKKMKKQSSDICRFCDEQAIDNIDHFFVHCKKVKIVWTEAKNIIQTKLNKNINITENIILTGISNELDNILTKMEIKYINHIILIAKMCIGRHKYGKGYNLSNTFEHECKIRKMLDYPV